MNNMMQRSHSCNLHEKDKKLDLIKEDADNLDYEYDEDEDEELDDVLNENISEINENFVNQQINKKNRDPYDEYKRISNLWTISLIFLISITILICAVLILISITLHINILNRTKNNALAHARTTLTTGSQLTELHNTNQTSIIISILSSTLSNAKVAQNSNRVNRPFPIWQICLCLILTILGLILLYFFRRFCCQMDQNNQSD